MAYLFLFLFDLKSVIIRSYSCNVETRTGSLRHILSNMRSPHPNRTNSRIPIFGAPSPVYALLYQAVRESNLKRRGKHQMRILCGDPYIDWEKVKDREDVGPYLGNRDQWYAQVVKSEVLAKKHHAFLGFARGAASIKHWMRCRTRS